MTTLVAVLTPFAILYVCVCDFCISAHSYSHDNWKGFEGADPGPPVQGVGMHENFWPCPPPPPVSASGLDTAFISHS